VSEVRARSTHHTLNAEDRLADFHALRAAPAKPRRGNLTPERAVALVSELREERDGDWFNTDRA
jgi:hypothetical protein